MKKTMLASLLALLLLTGVLPETASAEVTDGDVVALAQQGDAEAQYNLGRQYYNGQGVTQDDQQAFAWFSKAAAQGYAFAQYNLGTMYLNGQGVPQDDRQAFTWYLKAAEQGNARAQFSLGAMYRRGEGVPKDNQQAYAWYSVAVANGNGLATMGRDLAAEQLTPAALAEAQALASSYFELYQPKS